MYASRQGFFLASLASLALLAATTAGVSAQVIPIRPGANYAVPPTINTPALIAQGLSLQQYAYNMAILNRAYAAPSYAMGYNPYTPAVTYAPSMPAYSPYQGNPYLSTAPGAIGSPILSTMPGSTGYDSSLSTSPYAQNPYAAPYSLPDPYGGTYKGLAELTTAAGQYEIMIQKAKMLQEDVTRSRIETRQKLLEQAERERRSIPNPDDIRVKDQEMAVNRARRDPPITELLTGKSLNDLNLHLANMQAKGYRGPNVPLDDTDMIHINVVPVNEGGNIGLVKNLQPTDKLPWPSVLLDDTFKEARNNLDARLAAAVNELRVQRPLRDAEVSDMEDSVKKMSETLNARIGDLSPSQYIGARRYLSAVQDALTAMRSPNAINYFNGTWAPKGKNVAELVNYMKEKGLKFAAASPGNESAYKGLLYGLVAYDANMTPVAASK